MPYPAIYGAAIRTASLLRALASEEAEITFLTFSPHPEGETDLLPLLDHCRQVQTVYLPPRSLSSSADYGRRAIAVLNPAPYAVVRYQSPEMRQLIERHLITSQFDAVVADELFSLVNMPDVSIPLIVNLHNVEYLILKRYLPFERNPVKRAYAWFESQKLMGWEQRSCRRATLLTVCSDHDRDFLLASGSDIPVITVPNVVDTDYYTQAGDGEPFTIMYQGGMDWFPNRDAVQYFASSILPLVRRRIPGARFVIAGRTGSIPFLARFRNDSAIEFTGTVDDMRAVVRRAAVCIVPLRIGSGTRLKILESAAMGKPVVATSLGAEGLDFQDGVDIYLRDDPQSFADAVIELLLDSSKRRRITAAARRCVEQHYGYPALRAAVRKTLDAVESTRSLPA